MAPSTTCVLVAIFVICGNGCSAIIFHRCRAPNPTGQRWTIDECSSGQVMSIRSAKVGYTLEYYPGAVPPRCSMPEVDGCLKDTEIPVRSCDGRRTCSFTQTITLYRPGTALCVAQRDGNFIRVEFTCVPAPVPSTSPATIPDSPPVAPTTTPRQDECLSTDKTAVQLSDDTEADRPAGLAVDFGNLNTYSCSDNLQGIPWWAVDLGEAYAISHVIITLPIDSGRYLNGLNNFQVGFPSSLPTPGVSIPVDEDLYPVCGTYDHAVFVGLEIRVDCSTPVTETYRYVIVQSLDTSAEELCIADICVYAAEVPTTTPAVITTALKLTACTSGESYYQLRHVNSGYAGIVRGTDDASMTIASWSSRDAVMKHDDDPLVGMPYASYKHKLSTKFVPIY